MMGRCGWGKEWDLEVAAPQPPSSKLSLNAPLMHKHTLLIGSVRLQLPGEIQANLIIAEWGKKKKKQPRNEESPLSCVGYFQRVALPFSQATAGCEVTCVGR